MMGPRSLYILSILLVLTTFTAAWPWPRWLPEVDTLVVRQDSKDDSNKAPATSESSTQQTQTSSPSSDSQKGSKTESPTPTSAPSASFSVSLDIHTVVSAGKTFVTTKTHTITPRPTSGKDASTTAHKTFDPVLPAGAISMVSPALIDGPQYYKVGDNVTFKFGYTNLLATPTALDVMASCTANNQMYTITTNYTVANATGTVIWDTNKYQKTGLTKLLTETYTLIIYDASSNITATAEPGYLAVYNQYRFGMYIRQAYSDLDDWHCATCSSGALGQIDRMTLSTVLGVGIITVLSSTWFVGGLGITL